ncbi:phage tail length tape measure family protein [Sphingobium sp.]|uniref:phage tail length tape measure family protein n=1 Tax=Sphingobium sp. TaxID=1912891 RepID=UPI000C58145F|nr:phage tail length tape measure family protein [Sphingobium sp.]MBS91041.1 hypothetical protein [Sphingobium sp.]
MAEERIDIEVTDKVDANAAKKLNQIADAADRGATYVDKLKSALANVNTSSVDKLVSAMARADSAQAKLLNAQVRLSNAQDQGSMAAAKLATQNQKLATETARTEAASARAAAAATAAESAALRLAAAQQRVTASSTATGTAEEQLASDLARAKAQFDAGEISIRAYVAAMNQARAASTGAAQPIVDSANGAANAAKTLEAAQSRTRSTNANIIAQLQDIGVSLAGGQNPLLVLVQQGSQLDYIARTTAGGWAGLVAQIVRLLAPLTAIAAAIGLVYVGFKNFSSEIAAKHKPELEAYANSLGLTSKEMDKLSNSTVGAGGKLKEFDVITITAADSWNGFKSAVAQGWDGLIAPFAQFGDTMTSIWSTVVNFLYMAFLGFYASVKTLLDVIGKTAINVVKIVLNAIMGTANAIIMVIQGVINGVITGINFLAEGANGILSNLGFDKAIPEIDKVNLGIESISQNMFELEKYNIGETFTKNVQEANNTIQGFKQAWDEAATAAAKARIAALAAAIIDNRGPGKKAKVDHTAEKEAFNIGMVNMKLDDELARMKLLKDAREVQQRMDTIEQQLAQKKITLNATERASILAKVQAIQDYKYVQQEMDRIYDEINAPLKTYNASIAAATQLLNEHNISQDQFNQEKVKAGRILAEATDPLFQLKEAQDAAAVSVNLFGVELDRANYYETVRQAMLSKGIVLSQSYVAGTNAEVDALIKKNDQLRQQQFIQSQLGGVLNPILQQNQEVEAKAGVYAQLEALRQQDLINEDTYQQALAALYVKYNEQRLTAASDFFGALAGVTKNGSGVVGAISKAAAIAQATIDGYVAAQKALASAPPPFNYIAAAAIGLKTGANVAAIMSTNVGGFATGGQFMVDGKSGVDANNINMNVTKGERVTIETPAQQRANDGGGGDGAPVVDARTKVVNLFDEKSFVGAMDSEEGERVVMNIIRRNRTDVGTMVKA